MMRLRHPMLLLLLLLGVGGIWAQPQSSPTTPSDSEAITLSAALKMAQANSVQFRAAQGDAALAREDRVQARSTLLPGVIYDNQFLYTQGNGTPTGRFIANNGVHEYVSQGNAHQLLSVQQWADYRKAGAVAAMARARAEVAARGLVVTVVRSYYAVLGAEQKHANASAAAEDAAHFLSLSQKLEAAGEAAHSDVLKAQLQCNDRKRELEDSQTELLNARLELAVLILPSVSANIKLTDRLEDEPPLPPLTEVREAAANNNPELRAALATMRASHAAVDASRAAYLPSLALDFYYGIDATHFATRSEGVRNLGYAASATLNIPVFDWGATRSRVRQSLIRLDQSKLELTVAQKQLLANVEEFYHEADTAFTAQATLRQSVEIATESLRLINLRYQAGESTALEVVDAQNTLNTARNAYVDQCLRYRLALANLQTLTGTL